MPLRAQIMKMAGKGPAKAAAKGAAPSAKSGGKTATASAKPRFTMQHLWRQALWGSTAAVALLVAVLSTRGEVASQRASVVLSSLRMSAPPASRPGQAPMQVAGRSSSGASATKPYDAEAANRQLTAAVRALTEDRDKINARLAAVEHNMDDMTGSIRSEIEAAKSSAAAAPAQQPAQPWPAAQPAGAAPAPATIAAITPPGAGTSPQPPSPLTEATAPAAPAPLEYGVDLGGGATMTVLKARWLSIAAAHPELLASMTPVIAVRERAGHAELRLVAGPMTSPEAAAQLCAALIPFKLVCRPSLYDGQHLAVR